MNVARGRRHSRPAAGGNQRHDHQSVLLFRLAIDRDCGRSNPHAAHRSHSPAPRVDVDDSHGRPHHSPQSVPGRALSRLLFEHGLATENVARKYQVSRQEQDEFALRSHQRAAAALAEDKFRDETVPLTVVVEDLDAKGKKQHREVVFDKDEGPRLDTSAEPSEN